MLKILSGRKLSKKRIEWAKKEVRLQIYDSIPEKEYNNDINNLFIKDDKILEEIAKYRLVITDDPSQPGVEHSMCYLVKTENRVYNEGGLLEKRVIETKAPHGLMESYKIIVYNPAGSFIGKKPKN